VRTPTRWALAVRRPDRTLHIEAHDLVERFPRLRKTMLRGIVALVDAISIGWRGITIAARVSTGIEPGARGRGGDPHETALGAVVVPILVGALLVFVAVPGALSAGRPGITGDVVEAAGRALTLVIYLATISVTSQAQRTFAYHGAEHKTIAAFERVGRPPTLEEARAESTIHVRCGTDFMALFVVVAGVVYALVPRRPLWIGVGLRMVLVPVVAAIAYEVMRAAARYEATPVARLITWPGRLLQRITTREPSADMLEVAGAALHAAIN
jgi:uncharacterized protein YqhQ